MDMLHDKKMQIAIFKICGHISFKPLKSRISTYQDLHQILWTWYHDIDIILGYKYRSRVGQNASLCIIFSAENKCLIFVNRIWYKWQICLYKFCLHQFRNSNICWHGYSSKSWNLMHFLLFFLYSFVNGFVEIPPPIVFLYSFAIVFVKITLPPTPSYANTNMLP